jgi:hypothetical protein
LTDALLILSSFVCFEYIFIIGVAFLRTLDLNVYGLVFLLNFRVTLFCGFFFFFYVIVSVCEFLRSFRSEIN